MIPKCPFCKNVINSLSGHAVTISFMGAPDRRALVYSCPSCNNVLNCEIDPIALRTEIVAQVTEKIRALFKG